MSESLNGGSFNNAAISQRELIHVVSSIHKNCMPSKCIFQALISKILFFPHLISISIYSNLYYRMSTEHCSGCVPSASKCIPSLRSLLSVSSLVRSVRFPAAQKSGWFSSVSCGSYPCFYFIWFLIRVRQENFGRRVGPKPSLPRSRHCSCHCYPRLCRSGSPLP